MTSTPLSATTARLPSSSAPQSCPAAGTTVIAAVAATDMAASHPPIRACFRIIFPVSGGNSELRDEIGHAGPAAVGLCPQFLSGNLGGMGAGTGGVTGFPRPPRQPRRVGDGAIRASPPDGRGWERGSGPPLVDHQKGFRGFQKPCETPSNRFVAPSAARRYLADKVFLQGGGRAVDPTPAGGSKRFVCQLGRGFLPRGNGLDGRSLRRRICSDLLS